MRLRPDLLLLIGFLTMVLATSAQTESDYVVVSQIVIEGNKRTKPQFISRETGVRIGDTLLVSSLRETMDYIRVNVNNLRLFNTVKVTDVILPDQRIMVLIEVTERWYFYPSPILTFAEPNFNVWWRDKDFSRTNYGFELLQQNFRGRGEELEVDFQLGFSRTIALKYTVPYLSLKHKWGMRLEVNYSENETFNVGSYNNQRVFFSEGDGDSRNERELKLSATNRPNVFNTHSIVLRGKRVVIADSLLSIRTDHLVDGQTDMSYFGLEYGYNYRDVDRAAFPLVGTQFEVFLIKDGLGLSKTAPNTFSADVTFRNYSQLTKGLFLHSSIKARTTEGSDIPYYIQRGMGYGQTTVRGYELYIMDGQRFAMMRNNLKFELIPFKEKTLGFIKSTKFNSFQYALYVNLIGDLGYTQDVLYANANPRSNELLGGTGVGIDLLLSYDFVMRVEYMVNRLRQDGLYFGFSRSI